MGVVHRWRDGHAPGAPAVHEAQAASGTKPTLTRRGDGKGWVDGGSGVRGGGGLGTYVGGKNEQDVERNQKEKKLSVRIIGGRRDLARGYGTRVCRTQLSTT